MADLSSAVMYLSGAIELVGISFGITSLGAAGRKGVGQTTLPTEDSCGGKPWSSYNRAIKLMTDLSVAFAVILLTETGEFVSVLIAVTCYVRVCLIVSMCDVIVAYATPPQPTISLLPKKASKHLL